MNRNELEEILSALDYVGLKPVLLTIDEGDEEEVKNYKNPEEELGEYVGNEETLKPITITKVDFNKACDTVVYNNEYDFDEILTLARFTSKVRALLFDKDKRTEKEEK